MPKFYLFGFFALLTSVLPAQNCAGDFTLGADTTVCTGNSLTLRPNPVPAEPLEIEWETQSGLTVSTTDPLVATASPGAPTTYRLRVRSLTGPQLVTNGDFSQGNTGFFGAYQNWTGSGNIEEGRYRVTNNPRNVHDNFSPCPGNGGGGNMMVINAATTVEDIWCQTITVDPGATYAFSAALATVVSENPAELQFRINGQLLGSSFNAPFATCQWTDFFELWESGGATSATICINNQNTNQSGNDFAIDDISFRRTCVSEDSITISPAAAPVVTLEGETQFCDRSQPRSVESFLTEGPQNGIYTLDGATVSGNIDFSALSLGDHTLAYTAGPVGCQSSDQFTFNLGAAPSAGQFYGGDPTAIEFCSSELTVLREHLDNFTGDPGGQWSISGGDVNGTINANGVINWSSPARGNYRIVYEIPATVTCPGEDTDFSLTVNPQAEISLGADRSLTCDEPTLILRNAATATEGFTYVWSRDGTTLSAGQELSISEAGTYALSAVNSFTGCGAADTINIAALINTATLTVQTQLPSCGTGNALLPGFIGVAQASGVTPPLLFSLNDRPFVSDSVFNNLEPGTYTLTMEDAGGCTVDTTVTFVDPRAYGFSLSVSGDTAVEYGRAISVGLQTNLPDAWLDSLRWTPNGIGRLGDPFIVARAGDTLQYGVSVLTPQGCRFADSLRIRPFFPQLVYAPNAFSPNEDGYNDTWFPFTHPAVARIPEVRVFDRWGNPLYAASDPPLNAPENGWNGQVRGQRVGTGVYLWTVEVELVDGTSQRFSGEVVLLK